MTDPKKEEFCAPCLAVPALVGALAGAGAVAEEEKTNPSSTDKTVKYVLGAVSILSVIIFVYFLLGKKKKKKKRRKRR
jgi:hypothetical protein